MQASPHGRLYALAVRLDALAYRFNKCNEVVCALLAATMVFVVGFGVIERYILHLGHTWPEELARYIMIWMALLAVPVCAYRREHIGLDLLFSRFPKGFQPWLRVMLDLGGIGFFLLLFWYGLGMAKAGESQYATIFGISMLIPFLSVPVTSALTVFQLVVTMLREFAGVTPAYLEKGEKDAICSQ